MGARNNTLACGYSLRPGIRWRGCFQLLPDEVNSLATQNPSSLQIGIKFASTLKPT